MNHTVCKDETCRSEKAAKVLEAAKRWFESGTDCFFLTWEGVKRCDCAKCKLRSAIKDWRSTK